jgi:site-specific recombinase XerD
LKWLESNYCISVSAAEIAVPKTPKTLVRIYTDADIGSMLEAVVSRSNWLTARNRAMVFLMLDSGLRQGEVCTLLRKDIDFVRRIMKVRGKGNKERYIYFEETVSKLLCQYIDLTPHKESGYMFVNRHGQQLTPNSIKHMMYRVQTKLPFDLSSHKLRHNFATNYCIDQYEQYGRVDIYMLMNLMGHEDIKTTMIYLHNAMGILSAASKCSHIDGITIEI